MENRLGWLKPVVQLMFSAVLFALAGCTVCPPSKDNWSGQIEHEPDQLMVDEAAKSSDDNFFSNILGGKDDVEDAWYWQDGARKWVYTGRVKPEAQADQWLFESRSLAFHVSASKELNNYLGQPHTLVLKIIQLSDPGIISELRQSPFGLSDLMAVKGQELSGNIVREDRFDIAPGQVKTLLLDREEGVKYLAIVAGFFDMNGKKAVRIMKIPAVHARTLPCYDPLPWPIGEENPPAPPNVPGRLKIWLNIESASITNVEARVL